MGFTWAADHPRLACALVAAITLVLALQIPRLQIDTSTAGFMARDDPARRHYDTFKEKFGTDTATMLLVKADDVFTERALQIIQRLSDALEGLDGVRHVESLTTVTNIKGDGDSLMTEPLVRIPVPTTASELARIRRDALASRALLGNMVAANGRATAIAVYTEADPADRVFNRRFTAQVEALIANESGPGIVVQQIGGPLVDTVLGRQIMTDLASLAPLSLAVLFLFLLVFFRTGQGVLIPLATGVTSLVWTLGLMALLGLPLNVLTVIVPSLVMVIGSTEDVHMLSGYYHLLESGHDKADALRTMTRQTALPVLITTATTVVGFGSLVTSPIPVQAHFGYASAFGLIANFVVTLFAVPALLALWPAPRRFRSRPAGGPVRPDPLGPLLAWLPQFNLRHRTAVMIVAGLVLVTSVVGWLNLRVNTDVLALFPESSVVRQRLHDLHRSLTGFGVFYVMVETGHEDGMKDPEILRRIVALQEFLQRQPEVDKTVSVADYISLMHREMNGGDLAFETIPESREAVAQYLLTLEGEQLAKHLDFGVSTASIVIRHHMTGTWQYAALLRRLDQYLAEHFRAPLTARATGEALLVQNAADYLAVNELTSFAWTFVVIGLIHGLFFRSVWVGTLSIVPNVIPVLVVYAVMGLLDIPLNLGTAMIATIAIGVAVDDTVHHVITFRRQLLRHGDKQLAVAETMRAQGHPIVYVSLALAAGFLVFGLSSLVPVVHYGLLSAFVMLVAMVGELVLTPVVIYSAVRSPRSSRDVRSREPDQAPRGRPHESLTSTSTGRGGTPNL